MKLCRTLITMLFFAVYATAAVAAPTAKQGGRHALFVVIGHYGSGLPNLPGVSQDLEHARTLARALGVPEENFVMLRDKDATSDAIRRAGAELALRLAPSDHVVLYFSALGSHRADPDRPGACEETFVAADGVHVGYSELASHFIPVAERAEKTIVFFDICHSSSADMGSLVQRCVPAPAGQQCLSSMTRWRGFVNELRKSAVPTANIVAIAARPQDTMYGDKGGGVAGRSARDCLSEASADADQSGGLSFAEIAACAQGVIERRTGKGRTARLVVSGNSAYAPVIISTSHGSVRSLFENLYAGRDGRREVVLSPAGQLLGGGAAQGISLRSSTVGYLYLFSTNGQGYSLLFPTASDSDNRLRAGSVFTWPRAGASGLVLPTGTTLLAIVADNERDRKLLPGDGLSAVFGDRDGREGLFQFVTTSINGREAPCVVSGHARNLSLARACSDSYGAALLTVSPR